MKSQALTTLRRHLLELLQGGGAHESFDDLIADIPSGVRGKRPPGQSHTPWRLLEHLRITQEDILEFSRDPDWKSPDWPAGYWPEGDVPPTGKAWDESIAAFRADLQAIQDLIADESNDLLIPFPWASDGQTLFREAILLADHNSYHLGQLATIRRLLED